MKSDFIGRYFLADNAQAKYRERPERYSTGFSVLVILAVTLLGWAAIGYAIIKLIALVRSFSL